MTLDLHRHVRRSIRLRGYDYAQAGTYFVTICTRNHACLFGEVVDGEMRLNEVGRLVKDEWLRTGTMRPNVRVIPQEFVVMPNHVHGIVWLFDVAVGDASLGRPPVVPTPSNDARAVGATMGRPQVAPTGGRPCKNAMRARRAIRRGDLRSPPPAEN